MKTLDEVIEALEICSQIDAECDKCPYKETAKGWCEEKDRDALHYLKAFRDAKNTLEMEKDRYAEAVRNCDRAEVKYTMLCMEYARNDPLTWEQLKGMEGKPIWVEVDDGKYKGFVIVGKFYSLLEKEDVDAHVDLYYFGRSMEYSKEMYGYYWQAYRKERS